MKHLCAYGTLMCSDIMQRVTGSNRPGESCELSGYARYRIRNELYPAIVPEQAGQVQGVLYRDLSSQVWARLDRFEGSMYQRCQVRIRLGDGGAEDAETYVLRRPYRKLLLPEPWDVRDFIQHAKQDFMETYLGYVRLPR